MSPRVMTDKEIVEYARSHGIDISIPKIYGVPKNFMSDNDFVSESGASLYDKSLTDRLHKVLKKLKFFKL